MQAKINNILDKATGWMSAEEIAAKGKWRSVANVRVEIKKMAGLESRSKHKMRAGFWQEAIEYKLAGKSFGDDAEPVEAPEAIARINNAVPSLHARVNYLEAALEQIAGTSICNIGSARIIAREAIDGAWCDTSGLLTS